MYFYGEGIAGVDKGVEINNQEARKRTMCRRLIDEKKNAERGACKRKIEGRSTLAEENDYGQMAITAEAKRGARDG